MAAEPEPRAGGLARWQLGLAATGVLLAAADTYVVVLALLPILADLGIAVTDLQQATPIISGFLLGYVAVLPLIGRLSDAYGRSPVFVTCLLAFAAGSIVTATASTLPAVVAGRCLQGLGGGGLVPVTLALVGDLWPAGRRGVPLGAVGAVQELGSVLGPLYGAAVIAWSGWRTIFWINVPLAVVLGGGFLALRRGVAARPGRRDYVGAVLLLLVVAGAVLALASPVALSGSVTWGSLYTPVFADTLTWVTPLVLATAGIAVVAAVWELLEPFGIRPLLRLRRLPAVLRAADWPGAALLAAVLACVVLTFSAADPSRQVAADSAPALLAVGAALVVLFAVRERFARDPLIPFAAIGDRAAIGAVAANLFVGAALMAALVDVPIFARTTEYPDSQLSAALVLMRLLVGVPIGALAGGWLCERLGYRATTAAGMAMCGAMFLLMARWGGSTPLPGSITAVHASDAELFVCGLGFGLAIAPVNAALLSAVRASLHGLAASLVVVARMIGMLVGLSLLTALGLHEFYGRLSGLPACPGGAADCPARDSFLTQATVSELHVIFAGAACCAGVAAVLGLALLRRGAEVAERETVVTLVA